MPDGRLIGSTLPPADSPAFHPRMPRATRLAFVALAVGLSGGIAQAASGPDVSELPFALRSAAQRHPVTLFTSADCPPCADARAHLAKRGVPFAERSVRSPEDVAAFKQRGFTENGFPAATVGSQRLVGFQAGSWDQLLDLAGYPRSSALPRNWQQPAAAPAAGARSADAAPAAAPGTANATAAPTPSGPTPASFAASAARGPTASAGSGTASNGSGFRF